MTALGRAGRAEDGSAVVEFVWLALLVMMPLSYVVLAVFSVQSASYGVVTASRSAGRAFVLAPDQTTGKSRAKRAAEVSLHDSGVDRDAVRIHISCRPDPGRCLSPGSVVTVVVATTKPLPLAPDFLGGARPSVTVDSTHTEPYGTFREDRSS